jgi:hypothetical protein
VASTGLSSRSTAPLAAAAAEPTWVRMSANPSPAACMFNHAPTTIAIARISPSHAQKVRNSLSARNLMTVKIASRTASAALVIAGVTAMATLMFASRITSQTSSAIASKPARTPHPCHMLRPTEAMPLMSTSCQLKIDTIRNAIVPPMMSFAPCDSFEMSMCSALPFRGGRGCFPL